VIRINTVIPKIAQRKEILQAMEKCFSIKRESNATPINPITDAKRDTGNLSS